jgi:hypothetical protein
MKNKVVGFARNAKPKSPSRSKVRKFQEKIADHIAETGRAVLAILPTGATVEDGIDIAFAYSLGNSLPYQPVKVPEVLMIYPSEPTARFLINKVSDGLITGEIPAFTEGETREIYGLLGEHGEIPLRARLLSSLERIDAWDHSNYTCQLPGPSTPVLLIELPDPNGRWPEDPECAPAIQKHWSEAKFKVGPVVEVA